ncbi:phage holin family protein [Telluribacter humicola]|uniref:phage holin family protein n=1 Tax=Telluribacter humicola TaxID=1720261 RepID=UPI001A96EC0C|nr:phage holin family protein [Telluribacter humicola]
MIRKTISNILIGSIVNLMDIFSYMTDKTVAIAWGIIGILSSLFKTYLFGDTSLLPWLGIFIVMDGLAGFRAAKHLHRIDPTTAPPTGESFRDKMASKLISYFIALVTLNALISVEIMGIRPFSVLQGVNIEGLGIELNLEKAIYFSTVLAFIAREIKSIHRNLGVVGFPFLGKRTMDRIDQIENNQGV